MLNYTILYCTVLYYTILYCTILYCTVLYYTVLYYTILYCTVLHYTVLYYYTKLYCTILYCTVLYYTTLFCTTLDYTILYDTYNCQIPGWFSPPLKPEYFVSLIKFNTTNSLSIYSRYAKSWHVFLLPSFQSDLPDQLRIVWGDKHQLAEIPCVKTGPLKLGTCILTRKAMNFRPKQIWNTPWRIDRCLLKSAFRSLDQQLVMFSGPLHYTGTPGRDIAGNLGFAQRERRQFQ